MPIIEVKHLTKEYDLGTVTGIKDSLRHTLAKIQGKDTWRRERFKALDDVNFTIEEGEVVGIIGHNGAGKSTLLKHLANITKPTKGEVIVRGSIAPLIEVGAGVNPELTGRENIFLNGAILGIPKKVIQSKLDEIIDFSELEQFIDTPVKRYSSGMTVKLGFSIATSLDADILIIDEVLAVGDLAFQRKCFDRMEDMINKQNKTVIIVGHNIRQIERISSRMIILKNGVMVLDSTPNKVSNLYYKQTNEMILAQQQKGVSGNENSTAESTGDIEFSGIQISQNNISCESSIVIHKPTKFNVQFSSQRSFKKADLSIGFHTSDFVYIATFNIGRNTTYNIEEGDNEVECIIQDIPILPGTYGIRISIVDEFSSTLWSKEGVISIAIDPGEISRTMLSMESMIDIIPEWKTKTAP
ncbi:MAG: ATP-binding cassette domain-containing protein [Porticoccaceae bacterium]|nr:ATP-binding cassette domain-containing protein [Porticoccaceae bacterium]